MTTDREFRVRQEARSAIARLVKDAGGQMVTRPLIRSEPQGRTTQQPEPLPGFIAAVALEREARRQGRDAVRYAREDGKSWAQIGEAMGADAAAAFAYATGPADLAGPFTWWRCPDCGETISDRGPEIGNPADTEEGHGPGCARLAAAVAAWEAQWADG